MDLEEKLIDLVRPHKELYDLKEDLYKNTAHKTKLWADIGLELNLDAEACRKRWIGLRSCYRRAKRSEVAASGSAATFPKKKWRHIDTMTFLDDVQCCRRTIGNILSDTDNDENLKPCVPLMDSPLEFTGSPSLCSLPASSPSGSSFKGAQTKKAEIESNLASFLQVATTSIENVSKSFMERSGQATTTTEKIFLGLANALDEANLNATVLTNIQQNVSQYVYDAINKNRQT